MSLTKLQVFILTRICKTLVIQGPSHELNIIEYYKIINEAARKEFTEDSKVTLDTFLADCHARSLK